MRHVVVRRTGFLPYFLCAPWSDGTDRWDCHVDQAHVFGAAAARRIADQLNAKNPCAVIPATVEVLR
ncbi:MAG TPA: hypothetical protein VLE97_09740 [Gaiellaceae bacterium]|nr:hypothetical protein [Gaiellaceae bacterium]